MRLAFLLVIAVAGGCAGHRPPRTGPHEARLLDFAGRTWSVREAGQRVSPGPNRFSDRPESVWVDGQGALHLRVVERDGSWWSAEVLTPLPPGPVQVEIDVATDLSALDPRVVFGFFAYSDDRNEVDIEFSRWGFPHRPWNAQYALAPYGEGEIHRFQIATGADSSHLFDWREDRVAFASQQGGRIVQEWRHTAPRVRVMRDRPFQLHLNLWLAEGQEPMGGGGLEVVVRGLFVR